MATNSDRTDHTWTAPPRRQEPGDKHAYLCVISGPQLGEIFHLEPGRELVIGRKEDADVRIGEDGVSRRHASICADGASAQLKDLGSQNGTFVDHVRVTECRLEDGDRIQLGFHTTIKFIHTDELEAEYQRKLAEGALHEPLTGLYNRRHLMDRLSAELAAAQRHNRALSLLLIDVDYFKKVNDAHGHLAGDEALKMVAYVLQGAVRKEDILARFGGEEFVVLARETALGGARALAERIRRAVERSQLTWQDHELSITVSIGVTVAIGLTHFEPGRTERELLAAADRALYQAKAAGRNRVVVISSKDPP